MSNGRWNWFGFTNKDINQLENQTNMNQSGLNQLKLNQSTIKMEHNTRYCWYSEDTELDNLNTTKKVSFNVQTK
jgi:hypothetical protein|tara:strand:- start:424 stop:645 length:222 start_codon:yes stop_codon:yes gene_type:complete